MKMNYNKKFGEFIRKDSEPMRVDELNNYYILNDEQEALDGVIERFSEYIGVSYDKGVEIINNHITIYGYDMKTDEKHTEPLEGAEDDE